LASKKSNGGSRYFRKWDGPAVLLPRQRSKLAGRATDEEHARSEAEIERFALRQLSVAK